MTTCLPKTNSRSFARIRGFTNCEKGFTLLEIVIVLLVIGVVTGGSIAAVVANSSERALKTQSGKIEMLAKKARTAAILHQTPYAIEFHPGSVKLMPFAQTKKHRSTTALGNEIGGGSGNQTSRPILNETIEIDPDIILTIRRWNTDSFIAPTENEFPVWRFDPDGLCEPITVRFVLDESYAQDTYHPLTAGITDSQLDAK